MNILICTSNSFAVPCAALNRLSLLSDALNKFNNNVFLCGFDYINNDFAIRKNRVICNFPKKHFFLPKAFDTNLRASIFYKKNLSKIIKRLNIDIVIVYSTFSTLIDPINLICHKHNIKCVVDCGERMPITPRTLLNGVFYMQTKALVNSFHNIDGFIVLTPKWEKFAKSLGKKSVLFPALLPQFEKLNNFQSTSQNKLKSFRIIFMGRLFRREMPMVLIKAIDIANQKGLSTELIIIGNQGSTLFERLSLRKVIKNVKKNKNIKTTGFLSNLKKTKLLDTANCFVHLRNDDEETAHVFPTRLPEYFATSKPVILTNVEPFSLLFKHKKEVFFIPKTLNPEDLANAFLELNANKNLALSIGRNGKRYASKYLSSNYIGKKVNKFLKELK